MGQRIANDNDFLSCMFKRDMTVSAWYVDVPMSDPMNELDLDLDDDGFIWAFEGNGPR